VLIRLRRAEKDRIKEGEAIDKAEKEAKKKAKGDKGDGKKEKKSKKDSKKDLKKDASESDDDQEDQAGSGSGKDASDDDDDVTWSTDTSAAAAAARAAEQLTDGAAAMVTVTKAAQSDDAQPPAAALTSLSLNGAAQAQGAEDDDQDDEDGDEDEDPMVRELRTFAAKHSASETAAHLRGLKCENMEHRMHLLVAASLDSSESAPPLNKQLAVKATLLCAAAPDAAQRGAMLASLERWLVDDAPAGAAKSLGQGLHALYDADVLDEPSILAWYDNLGAARKFGVAPDDAQAVRKAAAVFVEWLRNAESDESEEE